MASEYVFFEESLRDRFVTFAGVHGLAGAVRADPIAGWVVELPDDVPDDARTAIEAEYDAVMDLQRERIDAADDAQARDLMSVNVTLPGGRPCLVRLPAAYGRRLVEHFTFDEIHELVTIIARNVADPVDGPMCRDA